MNTKTYMSEGDHLPDFMKDFHDQKDLFKAIYDQWQDDSDVMNKVNWVDAHCFTLDIFLWWMGHHGYKLQKIRKKDVEFYDPIETIERSRNIRRGASPEPLKNAMP